MVDVFAVILSKALNLTITESLVVICGILDFNLEVFVSFSSFRFCDSIVVSKDG